MEITFTFEGNQYKAPQSFYDTNEFTLPDGRVLSAQGWAETWPPRPQGLYVKASRTPAHEVLYRLPEHVATLAQDDARDAWNKAASAQPDEMSRAQREALADAAADEVWASFARLAAEADRAELRGGQEALRALPDGTPEGPALKAERAGREQARGAFWATWIASRDTAPAAPPSPERVTDEELVSIAEIVFVTQLKPIVAVGLLKKLAAEVTTLRPKATAFDLLRAEYEAARDGKGPCGHKIENLIYGGPDADGLPAVAQCGQCLADRQAAREKLPRTPERVLRAMLKAYEKALLEAKIAAIGAPNRDAVVAAENLATRVEDMRSALALMITGRMGTLEPWLGTRGVADYEARLRGERALNAPPAEV